MINIDDLKGKLKECIELLKAINKENVRDDLYEQIMAYTYQLLRYEELVNKIEDYDNLTEAEYNVLKRAYDNIEKLYKFKFYMERLSADKESFDNKKHYLKAVIKYTRRQ